VRPWREARRAEELLKQARKGAEVISDKRPALQDYVELVLKIPAETKDVIRDEIRLRRVDSTTFAAYGP
jgi:precorrin-4 methylase